MDPEKGGVNGKETNKARGNPPVPCTPAKVRHVALLLRLWDWRRWQAQGDRAGRDYGVGIKKWAELEHASAIPTAAAVTFRQVAQRYQAEVVPTKALSTQGLNNRCITALLSFFDVPPVPFEAIRPINIRQYLDWRPSKVIANREVSLFSHIWNWARGKGVTDLPNPRVSAGTKRPVAAFMWRMRSFRLPITMQTQRCATRWTWPTSPASAWATYG